MTRHHQTQYETESQFDQQRGTGQSVPIQTGQRDVAARQSGRQGMPARQGTPTQQSMPTRQTGQQEQWGQQTGQPQMTGRLDDALTEPMRVALHDFGEAANVTEWCAEKCIDLGPEMAECLRLCRDVSDLAALNARLIARDSAFGPALVEVFIEAAEACAQECARHQHEHCQECAEVLPRAAQSARAMLASFEGQ